ESAAALRQARPSGAPTASRDAFRVRRVALREAQHRLPLRARAPLLFGAASTDRRTAGRAFHVDDGPDFSARPAHRLAPEELPARWIHDEARAHAEVAPRARRVDAISDGALGKQDRPPDDRTRVRHPARSAAPGAGLPVLSRHLASGE